MSATQAPGKQVDPRNSTVTPPMQMEFAFAQATGMTVENLKRMRALRRALPPPRVRSTGMSPAARGGG